MSPERMALIEAFKKQSEGLEKKFEARTHKSDWVITITKSAPLLRFCRCVRTTPISSPLLDGPSLDLFP